jgi:hypothetical protein
MPVILKWLNLRDLIVCSRSHLQRHHPPTNFHENPPVGSKVTLINRILSQANSLVFLTIFYAEYKHATIMFLSPIILLWHAFLILLMPQITFFNVRIQKYIHTRTCTYKYCIVHWKCRLGANKSLLLLKLTCFLVTGSQTVQADSCTDMFRHEAHLYMRVTVLSVVSQALPCKHQKCFLFCSVKCVTSLCHSLVLLLLPLCL